MEEEKNPKRTSCHCPIDSRFAEPSQKGGTKIMIVIKGKKIILLYNYHIYSDVPEKNVSRDVSFLTVLILVKTIT